MTARIIVAGAVWTPTEALRPGWVAIQDGRIAALGQGEPPHPPAVDARAFVLVPGFVDIHIHGGFGHDLMAGGPAAVALSAGLPRHGCTAYLATTVTAGWDETLAAVSSLAAAVEQPPPGARPVGLHLEGPFLNPLRRGMQPAEHMRPPTAEAIDRLLEAGRGHVRTVTLAPELPGGLEAVEHLARRGVVVAMAHSDATYDQAATALARGARHVTHCFNAMRPLHHRDPGVVGAALDFAGLTTEAIADGVHVHPVALRLLWRVKGGRRLALVTDAMLGTGAPEGLYRFGGQEVRVRGGEARLADGTLAGSVVTLDRAIRVMAEAGVPPREAVAMASATPAEIAGLPDAGRLAPGCRADLVALDPELNVAWTMISGELAWSREAADTGALPGRTRPGP